MTGGAEPPVERQGASDAARIWGGSRVASSELPRQARPAFGPVSSLLAALRRAAPGSVCAVLGLPDGIEACLFDLDGVLTKTAVVHFAAWKELFDGFLREHDPEEREFSQ